MTCIASFTASLHFLLAMTFYLFITLLPLFLFFFFFNDTATTEIYTLSLHDALPICFADAGWADNDWCERLGIRRGRSGVQDRKSTRLNSSHSQISYAVFCLKKKKKKHKRLSVKLIV